MRTPSYSKYRNKKTVIDNVTFASIKESERYLELKMMQKVGKIFQLELQPKFLIHSSFTDNRGVKHRAIHYVADFRYFDARENRTIVEDVKGKLTSVYLLKRKMFLAKYKEYVFREL